MENIKELTKSIKEFKKGIRLIKNQFDFISDELARAFAESKKEEILDEQTNQDIAEDKVHEEEQVVSPQQEELDNSGIVPEEGNEV